MKEILKRLIPPLLLDIIRKIKSSKYGWHGDFKSWEEAKKYATGYEAEEIIKKVREATLKVKRGEAIYERDGVIFNEIQYSWPLLAGLMYAAAKSGGVLKVCDFGGSLGSTYFQNKKFLDGLKKVSWNIVEQKHFVDVGKVDFENEILKFYYDLESCIKDHNPNVLILSSVLQYLEKPYEMLDKLLNHRYNYVLVDRTPMAKKISIKLQIVPPEIYNASYPCWFFNEKEFKLFWERYNYRIIEEFNAIDSPFNGCIFKGFILENYIN